MIFTLGMTRRTSAVCGTERILLFIYLWSLPPVLLYQHLLYCSPITIYGPMPECAKQWYFELLPIYIAIELNKQLLCHALFSISGKQYKIVKNFIFDVSFSDSFQEVKI